MFFVVADSTRSPTQIAGIDVSNYGAGLKFYFDVNEVPELAEKVM